MTQITQQEVDAHNERQRAWAFNEGLRQDSLKVGAIPNPHAKRPMLKRKFLPLLVWWMFSNGLPQGWGK